MLPSGASVSEAKPNLPPITEAMDAPPVAGGTDWFAVAGLCLVEDGWMTMERYQSALEVVRKAGVSRG